MVGLLVGSARQDLSHAGLSRCLLDGEQVGTYPASVLCTRLLRCATLPPDPVRSLMPDRPLYDDAEPREDAEEYLGADERRRKRAAAARKAERDDRDRYRHEDQVDDYRYGEESGEAYETGRD